MHAYTRCCAYNGSVRHFAMLPAHSRRPESVPSRWQQLVRIRCFGLPIPICSPCKRTERKRTPVAEMRLSTGGGAAGACSKMLSSDLVASFLMPSPPVLPFLVAPTVLRGGGFRACDAPA